MEDYAALLGGLSSPQGWLALTNKRLMFMPASAPYIPAFFRRLPVIEIQLSDVVALGKRRWLRRLWSALPWFAPFVVELRDGTSYTFQASLAEKWRSKIADAAKLGEVD